MIIKNDFIKIKTNREFVLHNYIYDEYLSTFSRSQYLTESTILEELNSKKVLDFVYIKFEDTLENYKNADKDDFDLSFHVNRMDKETNSKGVNIYYDYTMSLEDVEKYKNKKITALGFGNYSGILACVDTSDYGIYIIEGEKFRITRKDIFSSDAECVGYNYPVHLSPQQYFTKTLSLTNKNSLALLYSVGFGTQKGIMQEEKIIDSHPALAMLDIDKISDTEFGINLKRTALNNIYPNNNYYGAMGKTPVALYVEKEISPNANLYAGVGKYPMLSNYQYIILKYQLYHFDSSNFGKTLLVKEDKFYTMNYPLDNVKGLFELRTKIERRN